MVFWGLNMKLLLSGAPHLTVDPPIRDSSTRIEGENQFGKNVQLQAQVSIRDSVIGNDVHIGQNTLIKQCVILDNTLIGPSLQLERKVISGDYIYDIERDLLLNTDDIDLSTTLNRPDKAVKWRERCVAAILLIIFSPLLLLGQQETIKLRVVAAKDFSGRPITKLLMLNVLHSKNPFLQKTPWLLSVVRGILPLFGPSLCKPYCTSVPGVISASDLKQPLHTKKINLLFKWLGMTLK